MAIKIKYLRVKTAGSTKKKAKQGGENLIQFTNRQLKELVRKNLEVPIKTFTL